MSEQMTIQQAMDLARKHQEAGRMPEAENLYRQVLAVEPNQSDALHSLGLIGLLCGHVEPARELVERAIAISSGKADYHRTLGDIFGELRRPKDAAAAYRRALDLKPTIVEAWNNMGVALVDLGMIDEAMAAYRKAIQLRPDSPSPYTNLSFALREQGKLEEAIMAAHQALVADKTFPDAHNNLGAALFRQEKTDEAISAFRNAIALRENFPQAHINLGMALLRRGDFEEGWKEYAWRSRMDNYFRFRAELKGTNWTGEETGEEIGGRRILLHAEQGFGDAIQFARYVPLVAERGAKVVVACQSELARLFGNLPGVEQVVTPDDPPPDYDLHCPLPSLPQVFGTTLSTIPSRVPYLSAPESLSSHWRERLAGETRLKVGLVWAGRTTYGNDRARAMTLAHLAPLAKIKGICWISLQKGDGSSARPALPAGMELLDWTDELKDFADTAALMENLDLVISVDTAPVHLAGALGKKVWVMLAVGSDWRWMLGRADSPWYPTMKLFRQLRPGDWSDVIEHIAGELECLVR